MSLYLGYKVILIKLASSIIIDSILGKLAAVDDLLCEPTENLCIQCSWNPPFSLTPIPQYITTNEGEDNLLQANSTTTNITYCPHQYGQYSISVAADNAAGLGNVTYKTVKLLPKGNISFKNSQ